MRTVTELIEAAGGPAAIASRVGLTKSAVHKWPLIGIQDRYWDTLIELAGASAEELHTANRLARETAAQKTSASEPDQIVEADGKVEAPTKEHAA